MAFFKEELQNVKAFVFDVDGVLSRDLSPLDETGEPMRTANVKDGYAIRIAISKGYPIAIVSGARNENIRKRYNNLGIKDIYLAVKNKTVCFNEFLTKYNLKAENTLFMAMIFPITN
jgi:3-deoxy-D-manno-octulosonate 8-phosphate phosphatase (KDO 8-P phosphatase)